MEIIDDGIVSNFYSSVIVLYKREKEKMHHVSPPLSKLAFLSAMLRLQLAWTFLSDAVGCLL